MSISISDRAGAAAQEFRGSPVGASAAQGVRQAAPREVEQWVRAGEAVVIDVREPDEYARERIDGARLLPLSRFDARQAAALAAPGQRLVMQCRSGKRAADAARMCAALAGSGVEVVSMTGGIEAWKQAGFPVEVDVRVSVISVMRQVQLVIGVLVLAGSALAWFVHPGFVAIPAFLGAGLTFAGASGTCALATLLGMMPWNRAAAGGGASGEGGSCSTGSCK